MNKDESLKLELRIALAKADLTVLSSERKTAENTIKKVKTILNRIYRREKVLQKRIDNAIDQRH